MKSIVVSALYHGVGVCPNRTAAVNPHPPSTCLALCVKAVKAGKISDNR